MPCHGNTQSDKQPTNVGEGGHTWNKPSHQSGAWQRNMAEFKKKQTQSHCAWVINPTVCVFLGVIIVSVLLI